MRCLSRIIKSAKVSLGKEMDIDNPVVVKTDDIIAKLEKEAVIRETKEKKEVKSQEEIEAIFMEEARKKSELFFNTEMQKAYDEGMQRANNDAGSIIASAQVEAERILIEATQIKNNVTAEYNNIMKSMEKEILELVLEVSQKVIAKEIEKPDYIVGIVSEALGQAVSKKDAILKVSEEDFEFVMKNKEKMLLNVEGFGDVEIVKEASLERGNCLVETKFGIIDGSIKTRLQQIEQEAYKILNR